MQATQRNWQQAARLALVMLCCMGAIAALQVPQLQQLLHNSQTAPPEQLQREVQIERTRLSLLKTLPDLGFKNLIADWAFLNFLQYFGDNAAREKTDYQLSPDYFDLILSRDPYFLEAYTYASTSTALFAGQPERAIAAMQQGLKSLKPDVPPGSYYAWRQLGIDQLLFAGDAQAARQSFTTAAEWARLSTVPGSDTVAQVSQQTADFLTRNPNSKTAQIAAWTMVLSSAPDDRTQKTAVSRIEAIGGKIVKNPDGTYSIQAPTSD
jgi:tetratricopeptide (TPR) repeat protein